MRTKPEDKVGVRKGVGALLLLLFLILNTLVAAQDIKLKVDECIDAYTKTGGFSGSVFIARGGKILLSKGYEMANYEYDLPNTPQTKFLLGSVTKQFTAMAIMQLQEKGLLDVNDPINKYIPDYANGEKITVHHLLTHTSGIPSFTDFPEYEQTMMIPSPVEKTIERFKDKPLEFAPGEKFKYSNSGYILLGYIIEKVSGKSYEEFLKENIFQPLGMINTGYAHNSEIIKHRASGYAPSDSGIVNAAYIDMSIPFSAGALYSTNEDLYLWHRALYTEELVKKSTLDKIFTPFKENYGYGWVIDTLFNRKRITHGGGINGFSNNITRYVDDDVCVIVLSNFELAQVGKICRDLAAIVFGEKYELPKERIAIKVNPEILDSYVGEYELEPGFVITITKEDNRLFTQATGQPKVEIFPESEIKFFLKVVDAQLTFLKDSEGKVTQIILYQGGKDYPAKKIK